MLFLDLRADRSKVLIFSTLFILSMVNINIYADNTDLFNQVFGDKEISELQIIQASISINDDYTGKYKHLCG